LNGFSTSPKNFTYIVMVLDPVRATNETRSYANVRWWLRTTCRRSQLLARAA